MDFSSAKNMGKNIVKNVSKNLSGKHSVGIASYVSVSS